VYDEIPFLPLFPLKGTSENFFFLAPIRVWGKIEKELFGIRDFCRTTLLYDKTEFFGERIIF